MVLRRNISAWPKRLATSVAGLAVWVGSGLMGYGQQGSIDPSPFFRQVHPILVAHCLECHSGDEPAGELDLSRKQTALAGGSSGPVILPGDPNGSYLVELIRDGLMPPDQINHRLTADEIRIVIQWINSGAAWERDRVLSKYELSTARRAGFDWWALQPLAPQDPPRLPEDDWAINPIDLFILAELNRAGIAASPATDKRTLIRRATFDLLGLPPAPHEIERFVNDSRSDAYQRLIERLLASPRYGERWGRHWLDVVRFGETNGYETNTPRPNAWPYRDYVISSLNDDIPYTRFILEQIAGDAVGQPSGTGFLVGGPHDVVGIQNLEGQLQQRADDLDDILSTTATTFLGLSVGCARCHDHKFDPITQVDYFALQAVFAGVKHGEREIQSADYAQRVAQEPKIREELATLDYQLTDFEPLADSAADAPRRRSPVQARRNVDRFSPIDACYVRFTILATNNLEPCIDELEIFSSEPSPRNVGLASEGAIATASGVYANGSSDIHQLKHVNDGIYGNSRSWISDEHGGGWVQIELSEPTTIDRIVWARDREQVYADRLATGYRIEVSLDERRWTTVATDNDRQTTGSASPPAGSSGDESLAESPHVSTLLARQQQLRQMLPQAGISRIYSGLFESPEPTRRLHRGDVTQPREPVSAASLTALAPRFQLPPDAPEPQRRLKLAEHIADPENPLTARVMVNRLWHYHFGRGLVATPSNFGFQGTPPSHPELLDWLAGEFISRGWSLKEMHRLIMSSATYRQQSRPRAEAMAVDSQSRLLWRFPPRRLEAEPIRDAMLQIAGTLDLTMGGPGYDAFEPNNNYVHVYRPKQAWTSADWRRMVYQMKPRMEQDSTFGVFDCPDASQIVPKRNVSTTPLQALSLLNSPFVVEQSEYFSERLLDEAPLGLFQQIELGFVLALGRQPTPGESDEALQLVQQHGLAALCRALFNLSEFIYVK